MKLSLFLMQAKYFWECTGKTLRYCRASRDFIFFKLSIPPPPMKKSVYALNVDHRMSGPRMDGLKVMQPIEDIAHRYIIEKK